MFSTSTLLRQWTMPMIEMLYEHVTGDGLANRNEHLRALMVWLERYGYGCVTPTGEYQMSISVGSIDGFANHVCGTANDTVSSRLSF